VSNGDSAFTSNLVPRLEFLSQALYRRQRACPHCGSGKLELLARKYYLVKIQRCTECQLAFTDPIYESSLGSLYDRFYTGEGATTSLPGPSELEELKQSRFAASDKHFMDRMSRLREVSPGNRLLEVGSSWGYFLFQAEAAGFDARGIEIGERRASFGRSELGVRIDRSLADVGDERFDVVYTSHVLEHFTDLSRIFSEIFERLVDGGVLVIEVPHFDYPGGGQAALSLIGAVHPLGFDAEFFRTSLPRYGYSDLQFFDRWQEFPGHPVESSERDIVLCVAKRPAGRS